MPTKEQLISALDDALDQARFDFRVNTDEELAKCLGVSTKQISFWRNGRWTTGDEALISVLVSAFLRVPAVPIPEQVAA